MSARQALRSATRGVHDRVDRLFARLDLSKRDDYGRFLSAQASALIPLEGALDAAGANDALPGWRAQRRSDALRADLEALGLGTPQPQPAPPVDGEAALLGGLYVLEGSRLGGAVLKRAVGPDLPRQFLASVHAPGRWPALIVLLDRKLYADSALERAIEAALACFAMFEQAGWDQLND